MRVSNTIITRTSQRRLQEGLQGIDRARDDIATGIRLRKMSDDATSGGQVVRIGSSMRAITQFRRNANLGINRAQAEESVLNQVSLTLTRGIELGMMAANGTADAQTRLNIKAEVDQMLNQTARLGNTRFGDEYLFGGTRAGEAPFAEPVPPTGSFSRLTLAGNPVNPSGGISLEIGDNKFVTPNHNGTEVFLDTDALEALRTLSNALGANDPAAIAAARGMESAIVSLDSAELDLKAFRSDLRDTEIDKAMVELVGKQTLYQAAMSATSRILGLSLANYL